MNKIFVFVLVLIIGASFVVLPFADMHVRNFLGNTISVIIIIVGIVLVLTGIVGLVTSKKGLRVFIESLIEVITEFFINT